MALQGETEHTERELTPRGAYYTLYTIYYTIYTAYYIVFCNSAM